MTVNRRQFLSTAGVIASASAVEKAVTAQTAPDASLIVDCQSHVFVPRVIEIMRQRISDPLVYEKDGAQWIKMGDWHRKLRPNHTNVAEKLARMDACGIATTMLSTNDPGPEWFGQQGPEVARVIHDHLAEIAKAHPGRFQGLIVLPFQDQQAAEQELKRCVEKLGMRGILLYSNLAGRWPDEEPYRWVFQRAVEMDLPILLHPAMPMTTDAVKGYNLTSTLGNMFENTIVLSRIVMSGILDQFPDLKLVSPHLGGTLPYIAGRLDHQVQVLKRSNQELKKRPSDYLREIYMDIVSPLPEAMRFALDFSSPDRLLFSSDHPWVDPQLILDDFRSLGLHADVQAKILGRNAKQLFHL
jgi:predicted TIM-barrel fold metal-dependent hydrolase